MCAKLEMHSSCTGLHLPNIDIEFVREINELSDLIWLDWAVLFSVMWSQAGERENHSRD